MAENTKKSFIQFIAQAWLVILLGLVFGTTLAAVDIILKPRILENKRQKILREVPKLFSNVENPEIEEILFDLPDSKTCTVLKVTSHGQLMGWVFPGSGHGFADRIELLIAVNANVDQIRDISILKQSETPGLGDYITKRSEPFRKSFASGKLNTSSAITVKKSAENPDPSRNEVEAVSGATVSSDAIVHIVNHTVAQLKPIIVKGAE